MAVRSLRPLPVAPVLLLLIAAADAMAQIPGRTIRRSPAFEVECRFKDDLFADQAVEIIEQVWAWTEKNLAPAMKPAKRLRIVIYATRAEYAAAALRLGQAGFRDFQGFADERSLSCHILKEDTTSWPGVAMDPPNRNIIAHEAIHLMIMLTAASRGLFVPTWVVEGIPMWVEGEVMLAGGWIRSRKEDWTEGHRILAARTMLDAGTFPTVEDLVHGRWGRLSPIEAYLPIRMLWLWMMTEHRAKVLPLFDEVRKRGASPALPDIFAARLRTCLGDDLWAKADAKLAAFVRNREITTRPPPPPPPERSDGKGQIGEAEFLPGSPAVKWLGSTTARSYILTAELVIEDKGVPQADLCFGRTGEQCLRISFVAGGGAYLFLRRDGAGGPGPWTLLVANRDTPGIVADDALSVRLWRRGANLSVSVEGRKVLEHEFAAGVQSTGRCGVGGPPGSATTWSKVRIR